MLQSVFGNDFEVVASKVKFFLVGQMLEKKPQE
jgi:hypothetical protein